MKRNSTTVFIESLNATTPIPWVSNAPDFSSFTQPTLGVIQKAWADFVASGEELEVIPDPVPYVEPVVPDWDGLIQSSFIGVLNSIFAKITAAQYATKADGTIAANRIRNNIAVAVGEIKQAVQVTRNEFAVAAALADLFDPEKTDFELTAEEIALWNSQIDLYNLNGVMKL